MSGAAVTDNAVTGDAVRKRDDAHYRDVLNDLIDMGAGLARQVFQAAAPCADAVDGDTVAVAAGPELALATVAFDRIARCVRRTILLARALAAPPPAVVWGQRGRGRMAGRERPLSELTDAELEALGRTLEAERPERLDPAELGDAWDGRPAEEIVREICIDLGIDPAAVLQRLRQRMPGGAVWLDVSGAPADGGEPGGGRPGTGWADSG